MSTPYPPPVSRLLELGEEAATATWMSYLELGLGPEHVPDLVRLATDMELNEMEEDRPEAWAPVHAWRALGQLRAPEAVEPLLGLAEKLEDGLFTDPELAVVFGMIGRAAIPPLARVLADDSRSPALHVLAVRGLDEIATQDETLRDEVVPQLLAGLERWERNDDEVNAFLVDALTEMRVMEAAPLMEQAFAADRVDLLLRGDWEDVRMDLGLIERRERSEGPRAARWVMREAPSEPGWSPPPAPPRTRDRDRKNKRRQQKESRKKNRRRK